MNGVCVDDGRRRRRVRCGEERKTFKSCDAQTTTHSAERHIAGRALPSCVRACDANRHCRVQEKYINHLAVYSSILHMPVIDRQTTKRVTQCLPCWKNLQFWATARQVRTSTVVLFWLFHAQNNLPMILFRNSFDFKLYKVTLPIVLI